jgi:glycosyltransferase involved in cell wall biosynthesis
LRVLMVNYEFPPLGGGTGIACSQLLAEFAGRPDLTVDLITSGMAGLTGVERLADNIELHRLPIGKRDLYFWRAAELFTWTRLAIVHARKLSRERSYDVCHCWAGWPSGLVGYVLRGRLPYIVSLRGSDVPGYSKRLRWLDPLVMRHVVRQVWTGAARVVAVSRNLRTLAVRTRPRTVIDVIPNGVDIHRFVPGPDTGSPRILFVGRLVERKGVHVLLRAFAQVLTAVPDARLTLVGDGPERSRLEAMAASLGLNDRVEFRGHVAGADIPAAYREGAILVLPALADAMPNVVLEAMASGLAIVSTPTGGVEVVRGNGVIVPFGDADALSAALVGYLSEPERLAEHRRMSRRLAEAMSWSAVATFCIELYHEAVCARTDEMVVAAREFQLESR